MFAEDNYQTAYLERGLRFYNELGVSAAITAPDEQAPYTALVVRLTDIGARNASVNLEISFIPGISEASKDGVYLLQIFAALGLSTVYTGVAEDQQAALLHKIAEVNSTLPLGSFGVFADTGILYYKHNTLLHRDSLTRDDCAAQLDRMNGLILHQLQLYFDHLT